MLWQQVLAVVLLGLPLLSPAQLADIRRNFKRVWSEDFELCTDSRICVNGVRTSVWSFEGGDGTKYGPFLAGWGNDEIQCYTNETRNVHVLRRAAGARGVLAIEAAFHDDGIICNNQGASSSLRYWSSARLITRGKVAFGFQSSAIMFEARVKIPQELGAWPAFWLLPDTNRTDCIACGDFGDGWCISGEVDVLEARNNDGILISNVYYGGLKEAAWQDCHSKLGVFNASGFASHWMTVAVIMSPTGMSFFVNNTLVNSLPQSEWYTGALRKEDDPLAPFNRPFYMLLNLAVGGRFPAAATGGVAVTDTRRAPYRYLIDWVRVYREVPANSSSSSAGRRLMPDAE